MDTGLEHDGPIGFEAFFSHFVELHVNPETSETVKAAGGVHIVMCGRARLHELLVWFNSGETADVWVIHLSMYVPHAGDGYIPEFSTETRLVYIAYLWPTPGKLSDPNDARRNMLLHIGRQHIPSFFLWHLDFKDPDDDRTYRTGKGQPCQSVMSVLANPVLKENRVIVNIWSSGPMTFEGLVSYQVSHDYHVDSLPAHVCGGTSPTVSWVLHPGTSIGRSPHRSPRW